MDLDPVNFSDESFVSFVSIKANGSAAAGAATTSNTKMKNAEINTDDLLYMEAETNTKSKRNEVQVLLFL